MTSEPRYWAGRDKETGKDIYVYQKSVDVSDKTLDEVNAYAREHEIPGDARLEAREDYGEDLVVTLNWMVPVPDEVIENVARKLARFKDS